MRKCCAHTSFYHYNRSHRLANGSRRRDLPETCQRTATLRDRDGDIWCAQHANRPMNKDAYGPFSRMEA